MNRGRTDDDARRPVVRPGGAVVRRGRHAVVRPGRVLFELEGVTREIAEKAMALAAAKMPLRTKFVTREGAEGGA